MYQISLWKKAGLDVVKTHPRHRMSFSQPTLYSFINYTVQPRSQAFPVLFFSLYNTRKQKSGEKLQYVPTTFHNIPWFSFALE